jgi:hypothetical protein
MLFNLGDVVQTAGVAAHRAESASFDVFVSSSLFAHSRGDWGDLDNEDKATNKAALRNGGRLLSSYTAEGTKIWIITEHDRSVTTILFPSEY